MISKLAAVSCLMLACASVRAEQQENPAYKSWAKYKPGTSTTMVTSSDAGGQVSKTQTKSTLAEVAADKVVVDVVMSMEAAGQKMDMPAQKMEVPKMIEVPKAAPDAPVAGQPAMPKADTKTSDADVTVGAGTFKAKLTESTMDIAGSKTSSKVWMSDDVPGGMVKMEATTDGAMKSKTTQELTAFDKK